MRTLYPTITQRLSSYFGPAAQTPPLRLHAPSYPSHPPYPPPPAPPSPPTPNPITLLLLSSTDGRPTLIDLTRTLAEMSQSHKLHPQDITQDLIDVELSATTSVSLPLLHHLPTTPLPPQNSTAKNNNTSEPSLLILFTPSLTLDGYPPWQVRLTEIFCVAGAGTSRAPRVEYQAFLRGLWKFAGAEMRFGR